MFSQTWKKINRVFARAATRNQIREYNFSATKPFDAQSIRLLTGLNVLSCECEDGFSQEQKSRLEKKQELLAKHTPLLAEENSESRRAALERIGEDIQKLEREKLLYEGKMRIRIKTKGNVLGDYVPVIRRFVLSNQGLYAVLAETNDNNAFRMIIGQNDLMDAHGVIKALHEDYPKIKDKTGRVLETIRTYITLYDNKAMFCTQDALDALKENLLLHGWLLEDVRSNSAANEDHNTTAVETPIAPSLQQ